MDLSNAVDYLQIPKEDAGRAINKMRRIDLLMEPNYLFGIQMSEILLTDKAKNILSEYPSYLEYLKVKNKSEWWDKYRSDVIAIGALIVSIIAICRS